MRETSLHAFLKDFYTSDVDRQEVMVDGYLVDVVSGDLLIEIQTRNFYAIKKRITSLLANHSLRIIHSIPEDKWIVYLPRTGEEPISRRKSPSHGRVEKVFYELVSIHELLIHPNFSLEVLITREEEIRRDDGLGSWRRNGVSIVDRRLVEIIRRYLFTSPEDYLALIPKTLPQPFTNSDLSSCLRISKNLAGKMSYCLHKMGILSTKGKRNRFILYQSKSK